MKRIALYLLIAMVAAAAETPQELYQKALVKERSEGNLNEASQLYRRAADSAGKDHALAVKALLQLGGCYEKMGSTEARKQYDRIIRDYSDQKDAAAIARTRLGRTGDIDLLIRQIWSGENVNLDGAPSPDGRYLAYVNWKTRGNLAVRDLKTGDSRDLTKDTDWSFAESAVFMPDSNRVIYSWYSNSAGRIEVRMISMDGSIISTIIDRQFIPTSVSRDGKLVAGYLYGTGSGRQIAVLDLATKKLAGLKSVSWMRPEVGNFSPDGRFLTYAIPVKADSEDRDIHVISVDGSAETTLVAAPGANRRPLFTPDGSRVVFASNRSSRWDLWAVPVYGGRASAQPEIVKADVGGIQCLGFATDGSLYFGADTPQVEARTMVLDAGTWQVKGEPRRVSEQFINISAAPVWSPNGQYLAYVSDRKNPGEVTYVVRDTASSEEREFKVGVRQRATARAFRWFPDNRSLLLTEYAQGANGRFRRLDLTNGKVTLLFQPPPGNQGFWGAVSPDGRAVFYGLRDQDSVDPKNPNKVSFTLLARRDIETGEETYLARVRAWVLPSITTSFDGRYVAFYAFCETKEEQCLWAVPLSGGQARQLPSPKGRFIQGDGITWTPRGEGVFATLTDDTGAVERSAIWYLPLDGGEPHRVEIPFRRVSMPAVHPGGAQLGFTESKTAGHVSVMENLFPRTRAAR